MSISGGLTNFRKVLWERELLKEAMEEMYLTKFMQKSEKGLIQFIPEFTKEKGDRIYIGLAMKLNGEGVDSDNELEGNEEALSDYDMNFYIDQKRNAVKLKGRMDEQKAAYSVRATAKARMAPWLAEIVEKEGFRKLGGMTTYTFANTPTAPSTNRILYCGDATTDADMDNADTFTIDMLHKAKVKAETSTPRIAPIKWQGKNYYLCLIHPKQRYSMMTDTSTVSWQSYMQEAAVRGKENPIFTGADAIIDGVIIHSHNYVPTFATWGATGTMAGARALFCGQQALAMGVGGAGAGWNEKSFDFGNKWAIACGRIFGFQKPVFDNEDYGVISIDSFLPTI